MNIDRRTFMIGAAGAVAAGGCVSSRVAGAPHWVDLQVNGRVGESFTNPKLTEEGVRKIVKALTEGGTEGFLATIVTSADEVAVRNLRTIRRAMVKYPECGRHILGFHMEGPFISDVPGFIGAHPRDWVRDPEIATYDKWQDAADGMVKIVTIAGERKGAEEFTRHATAAGTVVSIGHSAMYKTTDLNRLAAAGAKTLTHLGNALPLQCARHENLMWTGLANPNYRPMFIADGYHLPRETIHGYVRACPLERLITVSDCTAPGGMPPGTYGDRVLEPDGLIRSRRTGMLSGSSCLIRRCVEILNSPEVGLSMGDCELLARTNPLRLIGMEGWEA